MQYDFAKTIALVKGGLMSHETTWRDYLAGDPRWQQTALVLTGPLILANVVLGLLFSRAVGGYSAMGYQSSFLIALVMGLVLAILGFLIAVVVFNFLAGVFGGRPDFSRAFAAVSLAAIPAWLAGIVAALIPGIGLLIALAGAIVTLVFLYKIMPLALGVPDGKRVLHFIVAVISIIVINWIVGMVFIRDAMDQPMDSIGRSVTPGSTMGSGMLGEMDRQGRLMEAAGEDVHVPPADGKLEESQVRKYASVMTKTRAVHEQYAAEMKKMADEMEAKEAAGEQPSPGDLARMFGGVGAVMGANNAEMEVVKTGGGNWAEHQWIKQQLRAAQIQQGEGDEAIEHNYRLYQQFRDDLEDGD